MRTRHVKIPILPIKKYFLWAIDGKLEGLHSVNLSLFGMIII